MHLQSFLGFSFYLCSPILGRVYFIVFWYILLYSGICNRILVYVTEKYRSYG